MNSESQI